jgi:hypothetical protein
MRPEAVRLYWTNNNTVWCRRMFKNRVNCVDLWRGEIYGEIQSTVHGIVSLASNCALVCFRYYYYKQVKKTNDWMKLYKSIGDPCSMLIWRLNRNVTDKPRIQYKNTRFSAALHMPNDTTYPRHYPKTKRKNERRMERTKSMKVN